MQNFKTTHTLIILIIFAAVYLSSGQFVFSQEKETDIVVGKRIVFQSKILEGDLELSICLPTDYATSENKYPVLYDLNSFISYVYDCGTIELLSRTLDIPGIIIIGLPALQNGYVPTSYEERKTEPAGADLSLKFIKEELKPFVEKNYRSSGFDILYGHSVGGLFTMYAMFTQPDLFSAYIASSPWFQNNDQYWLKNIEKMFQAKSLKGKFLFMTVGKEEQELTLSTYTDLEKWMKGHDLKGLVWNSAWFDNVDHGSMLGKSMYDGIMFIFDGWKIPFDVMISADIEKIENYLKGRTVKFGAKIGSAVPENQLNQVGYRLINNKEYDKAIKIFQYNAKLYPNSPNVYDSLAEAYLTAGDKDNAIKYYKIAIEKNAGKTDYEKRILESSRNKLKELGAEAAK